MPASRGKGDISTLFAKMIDWTEERILEVLDRFVWDGGFPEFSSQFLCLGASRLSLFRSANDWGLVIESFGYSPPGGTLVTSLYTFGSTICNVDEEYRQRISSFRTPPLDLSFNSNTTFYPIESESWQDPEVECEAANVGEIELRGKRVEIPSRSEYCKHGIELQAVSVQASDFMRWLSEVYRDDVLCSDDEVYTHLPAEMVKILVLDEWRHPIVDDEEFPSGLESFQQLAKVLIENDPRLYRPTETPNSHWKNWLGSGIIV